MKLSTRLKKRLKVALITIGTLLLISYLFIVLPVWGFPFNHKRHGNPPLTPAWALECWLWEDDDNTAQRVDELLQGYALHDIPVRTILMDSPWSLRYNDFEVDTIRYPKPEKWFNKLQDKGYRVVLWMTPMVNSLSDDTRISQSESWHKSATDKGYLIDKDYQVSWWKGEGGFIDYTNQEARKWWHGMQETVFDYGIDGWKLDGAATLLWEEIGPIPFFYKRSHKGILTTRGYMDLYYRSEYDNGLKQNPEFVTLSRSMDRGYHPEGFAPIDASPVNWVGDQKHYWVSEDIAVNSDGSNKDIALKGIQGFESAIENVLKSAQKGYSIVGSDIAGFSGETIPARLYIRWTQFSTFCGLFLNGGHGERALWKRSEQELNIIREYSWLHTELIPYMYSYVVQANRGGEVLQRPVSGDYHYMFGDNILVAPIYKDDLNSEVRLPKGKWRYWFDDSELLDGKQTFNKEFPLDEFPVYIKEGAIIPLNIERGYTGIGNKESKGYLTLLIYPLNESAFTAYDSEDGKSTTIRVEESHEFVKIELEGKMIAHILSVNFQTKPKKVEFEGVSLSDSIDYEFDSVRNKLIIKTKEYSSGAYIITK
ncbi:MAG: hypothetical protein KAH17_09515 [Bacteroidales bacterium]|nr:hypothetical protein [Bacteroidales bacterium]